jgi:16S rRNA (guanine527-N7)-methyltransferase
LRRHIFFVIPENMEKEMLLLQQNARKLGIDLSEIQLTQFAVYQKELLQWNAKTNLISEKSAQEIMSRHFLDSLTALQFIEKKNARIIDIGCGAGFPGLPLKIASPDLQLYLLETNRKKVSFLKHIIRLLNLTDTFVLHDRVENLLEISAWKDFFDILISRAAFKLPEMLPLGTFLLIPGGKLVALKGNDIATEFSQGATVAPMYGFGQLFQHDINQEDSGIPRKIIIGKKTK